MPRLTISAGRVAKPKLQLTCPVRSKPLGSRLAVFLLFPKSWRHATTFCSGRASESDHQIWGVVFGTGYDPIPFGRGHEDISCFFLSLVENITRCTSDGGKMALQDDGFELRKLPASKGNG